MLKRESRRIDAPPGSSLSGLLELIAFSTMADLRAERQRTYLGFIWWFVEPLLFMATFILLVDVLRMQGRTGAPFLIIGLVVWQWYQATLSRSMSSILAALPVLRNVAIPPGVFAISSALGDSVKFLLVLVVTFAVLLAYGVRPGFAWTMIPVLLISLGFLINGIGLLLAALVPFVPDLRYAINPVLRVQFFLSGIFFDINHVPPAFQRWLELNPMVVYIEGFRAMLLENRVPETWPLLVWTAIGVLLSIAGIQVTRRLAPHYAKLPA